MKSSEGYMMDPEETKKIEELRDLEGDVPANFFPRIRGKIERRRTSAELLTFSWHIPRNVFWEITVLLSQLTAIFGSTKRKL